MKNQAAIFLLSLMLFSACKKETCFGEAGHEVTVTRAVSAFHEIDIYGDMDVILTQDTTEGIKIVGPQHLEPNISTEIDAGVLTLKDESTCSWLRKASEKIRVYVSVKTLDKIMYAGSGDITSTNTLLADNITIYSEEGAGNINVTLNAVQTFSYIMGENADFTLHGTTKVCYSYTASRGTIDFKDFVVQEMHIEYGALRDATINVTESLDAIIYYKGNLFYKGTPLVTKNEVHSSGRLIRLF